MPDIGTLGYWSTIQKIYHDQYRCSGMLFQVLRVEGALTPGIVRKALYRLQRRHPLLRARFVDDDRYYRFQVAHDDKGECNEETHGGSITCCEPGGWFSVGRELLKMNALEILIRTLNSCGVQSSSIRKATVTAMNSSTSFTTPFRMDHQQHVLHMTCCLFAAKLPRGQTMFPIGGLCRYCRRLS